MVTLRSAEKRRAATGVPLPVNVVIRTLSGTWDRHSRKQTDSTPRSALASRTLLIGTFTDRLSADDRPKLFDTAEASLSDSSRTDPHRPIQPVLSCPAVDHGVIDESEIVAVRVGSPASTGQEIGVKSSTTCSSVQALVASSLFASPL